MRELITTIGGVKIYAESEGNEALFKTIISNIRNQYTREFTNDKDINNTQHYSMASCGNNFALNGARRKRLFR